MKVTVSKVIAGNENFVVELDDPGPGLEEQLKLAYRLMDRRNWAMYQRMRSAEEAYQRLSKEDPGLAMMVNKIFLTMFSQRPFQDPPPQYIGDGDDEAEAHAE
jgi:hypothetical protein